MDIEKIVGMVLEALLVHVVDVLFPEKISTAGVHVFNF